MSCFPRVTATVLIFSALSFSSFTSHAQSTRTYRASIPFEFHLSYGVMPAGMYQIVTLDAHRMRFRAMGTSKTEDVLVYPTTESDSLPSGQLRFTRYGDVVVLREFSGATDNTGFHYVSRRIESRKEKQGPRNLKMIQIPSQGAQYPIEIAISVTPLP